MKWEQHRFAAERARDRMEKLAQFLRSLDGGKRGDPARETFVSDWNKMIAGVSVMCSMYELPEPVMVFNPSWLNRIRSISGAQIRDTLIYANVKVRFAIFEQAEVLRTV